MFASKRKSTVIAEGLKIIGNVNADGAVEVNGQVDGDLHCTSLIVSPKALISGGIKARSVVVNGKVEGPISGEDVILKSHAFVTGDIHAQSLSIERGAHFDGRSLRPEVTNLRQVEEPASNGQLERVRPALFKKEAEPKTKIARRLDLKASRERTSENKAKTSAIVDLVFAARAASNISDCEALWRFEAFSSRYS